MMSTRRFRSASLKLSGLNQNGQKKRMLGFPSRISLPECPATLQAVRSRIMNLERRPQLVTHSPQCVDAVFYQKSAGWPRIPSLSQITAGFGSGRS